MGRGPRAAAARPHGLGWLEPPVNRDQFIAHTAWLGLGVGGLLFRTAHLFFSKDFQTGCVWITKVLTDPFHDVLLYWKAPLYLLKGELIDPMGHATGR